VRILSEDLVLFRREDGVVGLVHLNCPHRRASLEFGRIEKSGIRCCYHGWLFDVDGTLLEAPAEPTTSPLKKNVRLGAYPTKEFKGLIFAYLGPPDEVPEFPIYDTFGIENDHIVPNAHRYPCNWLQVAENSTDHYHVCFLHTPTEDTAQFFPDWKKLPVLVFKKRRIGIYYAYSRRVGDNIWVGSEDILLPNFTQAGAVWTQDGSRAKYFGRNSFTRWVVPVDDANTRVFSLAHFNERSDPLKDAYLTKESLERMEAGMATDRPEEEKRRRPGDIEAIPSLGPITIHSQEHLATSDRGVVLYRGLLRKAIRALEKGERPVQPAEIGPAPLPTYAGDTVLRIPPIAGRDDLKLVEEVSESVLNIYVSGDHLTAPDREAYIQNKVKELESHYTRPMSRKVG